MSNPTLSLQEQAEQQLTACIYIVAGARYPEKDMKTTL